MNFVCCFLMRKILFKHSNGLISVIQTLLYWKQWLRGGILTLNVIVQTQMMLHAQVAQIQQLSQKTPKHSTNWQSAEWTATSESCPKWPKMQTSAGKVLTSVFWNVLDILFIDYLEKGRPINSEYFIALLVCLKEEITKKRPQMKKKKCSFIKTMYVTSWSRHWQNYMNCTSNYFCTNPILQIWPPVTNGCLQTSKGSNEEVISVTNVCFEAKDKSFYEKGIKLLEKHWNQCITLVGDYVEE